jgi:hypothetical protein
MLGASAAFVGVVMLALMVFVDRAVGADGPAVNFDSRPAGSSAVEQPSAPKAPRTTDAPPAQPGERS